MDKETLDVAIRLHQRKISIERHIEVLNDNLLLRIKNKIKEYYDLCDYGTTIEVPDYLLTNIETIHSNMLKLLNEELRKTTEEFEKL